MTLETAARIGILVAVLLPMSGAGIGAQTHFDDRAEQFVFSKVEYPAAADTFAVMSVRRWPQPVMGVSLHYASPIAPTAHLDIYVSTLNAPAGPDATVAERLRMDFEGSLRGIHAFAENARDETEVVEERSDSVVITDAEGRQYAGWMAEVTLKTGSKSETSLLYVFEKNGSSVKYRITHERSLRTMLSEHIDAFVRETLGRVHPRQVEPPPA